MKPSHEPPLPPDGIDAQVLRRAETRRPGILRETFGMLRRHRRWWLTPIVLVLLMVGAFLVLAATPFAPFLYPLF